MSGCDDMMERKEGREGDGSRGGELGSMERERERHRCLAAVSFIGQAFNLYCWFVLFRSLRFGDKDMTVIREELRVRGDKDQDIKVGTTSFDQSKQVTVREPHRLEIHTFANLMHLCNAPM